MPGRRTTRQANPPNRLEQVEFGTLPTLPVFRAFSDANNIQTIPANGADTPVSFNFWENGNDNIFTPHSAGGLLDTVETLVTGGVWALVAQLDWEQLGSFTPSDNVSVAFEEGGMDYPSPAVNMPAQYMAGNNSDGLHTFTVIRGYPPMWMRAIQSTCALGPCFPEWRLRVAQSRAVDMDLTAIYWEIYLLGGLSVDVNEIP